MQTVNFMAPQPTPQAIGAQMNDNNPIVQAQASNFTPSGSPSISPETLMKLRNMLMKPSSSDGTLSGPLNAPLPATQFNAQAASGAVGTDPRILQQYQNMGAGNGGMGSAVNWSY